MPHAFTSQPRCPHALATRDLRVRRLGRGVCRPVIDKHFTGPLLVRLSHRTRGLETAFGVSNPPIY